MIPELIGSVCNLVISSHEILIITMISRYFQVWNNIDEMLLISVILDFAFISSVKNGFTVFQKVLWSAMSLVLMLLRKFCFSLLVKLTQRLHCLLYAFLSMSILVFKNLFLRRDLFMISLFRHLICSNLPLFYGSMSLIASSRAVLNWTNSRLLFS